MVGGAGTGRFHRKSDEVSVTFTPISALDRALYLFERPAVGRIGIPACLFHKGGSTNPYQTTNPNVITETLINTVRPCLIPVIRR
jgi:hypothetical protein